MSSRARRRIVDTLGLALLLLALLDLLRPSLLLLPTITAGGDTPCHYPTAVWFHERLLPSLRLHGWYPGAYLGHPLLLYYFPLPFLTMSALAPVVGMPAAFKLGTALGVFLLPPLAYASLRLMRLPFPAPVLGAASAFVFLYVENNPIWGGTIASTLAGEFSYTYGLGLALLFLGVLVHARGRGASPWLPALVLALTAFAHGYAVLWAGLTASFLLLTAARPWRTLGWLLVLGGLAFALAGVTLVPLLGDWGWTTSYDDAWITVSTAGLVPPLLGPLVLVGVFGVLKAVWRGRARTATDERLALLGWGAVVATALASAGPSLGVIDVRFVPFAQLAVALAGGATAGVAVTRLRARHLATLGLVALAIVWADGRSRVLRPWVEWNYSGLEAKDLWPAWRQLAEMLRGGPSDPRVAVEYGAVHERAGSIRMYETLPFFSGRSTLEGVYNQASLMTHPVYYLASELFASSPNPFRSRSYSRFDPETALARLALFNVGDVVAVSPALVSFLDRRREVTAVARIPPYSLYRSSEPATGYVEPLALAPVRSSPRGWRDRAYRWLTRKPPHRALLVFSDDPRFEVAEKDEWAAPPEVPLREGVEVRSHLEAESLHITTSRPGHPLLVKVSYHPRWRAEGAFGPYLVSPGLMLVVPRQREVRLVYAARTAADWAGLVLTTGALVLLVAVAGRAWARRARRVGSPEANAGAGVEPRLSGALARGRGSGIVRLLPAVFVLALAGLRIVDRPSSVVDDGRLYDRASRAFAEERFGDAAEYARHGAALRPSGDARRGELVCLQGESLLHLGHPREGALAFTPVVEGPHEDPNRPRALFLRARARAAAGDAVGAAEDRRLLLAEHPGTPWAERLRTRSDARAGATVE